MKAWVLKTENGKYVDYLEADVGSLNMATLWSTKEAALREGLDCFENSWTEIPEVKAVKVEIKEVK